jgi:hypothetical protein
MNRIRPVVIVAYVSAAIALFACAQGSTQTGGGEGGEGGESWGGPASSSSSGSTSSSSSSSGSGGPTVCDTTSLDCTACIDCSRGTADGLCTGVFQNCQNSTDCLDFAGCINTCPDGDTTCYTECEGAYPTGLSIFNVYLKCVLCQDCYGICEGATLAECQ